MRSLAEATGQHAAISSAFDWQEKPQKGCLIVTGPGGSGVSWTLDQICMDWEKHGGVALKATGVAITPPRTLLPWLSMRSPAHNKVARWETMKGGAAEASKAIPVMGEAASFLVNELLNHRRKKLERETKVLDEKEQDLLFVIESAAKGKRLMIAVDQLTCWDDESWGLLEIILSPMLHDYYPSLANAFVVFGASAELLPRVRLMADQLPLKEISLSRLERTDLASALNALGFPQLEQTELDVLFEATGGRLDLLRDFSRLNRTTPGETWHGADTAAYGRMIERRLRSLKGNVAALEGLLAAGSFLGSSFSREEAGCLTGLDRDALDNALQLAEGENLLGLASGLVSFPSDAMQRYFRGSRIPNPAKYHAKFAECLRRLRPGDYKTRRLHLLMAGQNFESSVCRCLAVLDAQRSRRKSVDLLEPESAESDGEFSGYLNAMLAAYSAFERDAREEGLTILQSIESLVPDALIAERDYLEAQFRLKSHSIPEFERAAVILKRWSSLQEVEPEIWSRIAQTLVVAFAETNRYEEAGFLEETLTKYYAARKNLDPWALYSLNCLRRRSECLHQLVPARTRLQSALAYFGPSEAGSLARHPIQYYCTLTNLVSNLIASGMFAEAMLRGAELQAQIQANPSYPWPSLEISANNAVLAAYLTGTMDLPSALHLMQQIDEHRDGLGDRLLVRNNRAIFLVHSGAIDQARSILAEAWAELTESGGADPYHRYLTANNLAGLVALGGDPTAARRMLDEVAGGLDRFPPGLRGVFSRRHAMMTEALAAAPTLSATQFDQFLVDRHSPQVGPQWAFYGRGFLFSDIQFWAAE